MDLATHRQPQKVLFWTQPSAEDSELATADPLAFDYLGQQIGLMLLPTLTTRSSRAQAFAMVLYGLQLVEKAIERYGLPADGAQRRVLFERWERFWALATLEHRGGDLGRSDADSMRGVRGAKRAWRPGDGKLPLDFTLISRQQELGNLGAYLAPLRHSRLVGDGSLRPTPSAADIILHFWGEGGQARDTRGTFELFALEALDPSAKHLPRVAHNLKLATVGERSKLTSLWPHAKHQRARQQERLNQALFLDQQHRAYTVVIAELVEEAVKKGITKPRDMIEAMLAGSLGPLSEELRALLLTARAFSDFAQTTLTCFDRVYAEVYEQGCLAPRAATLAKVFTSQVLDDLQASARAFVEAPLVDSVRALPAHGRPCVLLAQDLAAADASTALSVLLRYHAAVQRERTHKAGWLCEDGDFLTVLTTSYTVSPNGARGPSYKLDVVHSLLRDVGRVPVVANEAEAV